jgi:hypothetical protein
MKVLEIRILVPDWTPDETLCDVGSVIRQEIGATELDVHDVVYAVKQENAVSANFVM